MFHKKNSLLTKVKEKFSVFHFNTQILILLIVIFFVGGYIILKGFTPLKTQNSASYFLQKAAFYVEPFEIIKGLENAILVDLRPLEQYTQAHIIDAQHVKVDVDSQTGKILNADEIATEVKQMRRSNDLVILYGENEYSPLPSQVAALLTEQGIQVKLLSVGWNEFRHFSTFWIPENMNSRVNIMDYLAGEEIVSTN